MRKQPAKKRPATMAEPGVLSQRAFAAITAVEGLKLNKSSRQRLKALLADETLTPAQRRAAILEVYQYPSRKK